MHDLAAALNGIRSAWMAGRSALDHCPSAWREAAPGLDGECTLVALAGHATAVLFRPEPTAPIAPHALLPKLALPTLPEALRLRLRRLRAAQKNKGISETAMINLAAARGYILHPGDWLPSPRNDWAPDLYAPWLDWARNEYKASPPPLTLETYDQWSFAMRRVALIAMRQANPDAARAIIAAKAPLEPAERRVKLIEALEEQLSDQDADFLETLCNDRSDRVQSLARLYLARLGRPKEDPALAGELAETVKLGAVGWLSRRRRLTINALKPGPREARRRELFSLVSYAGLCRALGAPEDAVLETVPVGATRDLYAFVQMIATSGSDRAVHLLFAQAIEDRDFPLSHLHPLSGRLRRKDRRAALPRILKRDAEMYRTTLEFAGEFLGETPLAVLIGSPSFTNLRRATQTTAGEELERLVANATEEATLLRLGLLASPEAAEALIARLSDLGLSPADPKLAPLIFNAALKPEIRP
jgi:uncharacterized protein DUF5691